MMYRTSANMHRVPVPPDVGQAQALEAEGCKLVVENGQRFYLCPGEAPERVYEFQHRMPTFEQPMDPGAMTVVYGAPMVDPAPPPPPSSVNPPDIVVTEETFSAEDEPALDRALGWVQRHPFITIAAVGGSAVAVSAMRKPRMLPRTQNPAYLDPGFRTTYSRKARRWTVQEEIDGRWLKIGEVTTASVGDKEKFVGHVKGGRKGRPVLSPHRAARFVVDHGRIE